MGKEKHQDRTGTQRLTFYYEIIGLFSLIIRFFPGETSVVGFISYVSHCFGDWYFLILIALIAFGIRSLLVHKP